MLSMCGCAHGTGTTERAAPPAMTAPQEHAARAMRELEQAGVPAFDAYIAALAASGDPIDLVSASLLVDLVAHVQRDLGTDTPVVVGFAESRSPAARTVADAIAIGLRKHPEFRVSDRLALDAVSTEQHREYDDAFDEDSLVSVGTFHGLSAIGRVTIEQTGERSAITVRITSMRTLLILADARVTTAALLPTDATAETFRLAFPTQPRAFTPPKPPTECVQNPKSEECRAAIHRQVILTAREIRELLHSNEGQTCAAPDGRELPPICCKDPTLEGCR